MPIVNANTRPIQPGTSLPQMTDVLDGWMQPFVIGFVQTVNEAGIIKEVVRNVEGMGVVQPLEAQKLTTKPEGQRAFEWLQIHAEPSFELKPGELVVWLGTRYRVMGRWPWQQYGFVEYHLVNDYAPNAWRTPQNS